jgi:hypothetical protein
VSDLWRSEGLDPATDISGGRRLCNFRDAGAEPGGTYIGGYALHVPHERENARMTRDFPHNGFRVVGRSDWDAGLETVITVRGAYFVRRKNDQGDRPRA